MVDWACKKIFNQSINLDLGITKSRIWVLAVSDKLSPWERFFRAFPQPTQNSIGNDKTNDIQRTEKLYSIDSAWWSQDKVKLVQTPEFDSIRRQSKLSSSTACAPVQL